MPAFQKNERSRSTTSMIPEANSEPKKTDFITSAILLSKKTLGLFHARLISYH